MDDSKRISTIREGDDFGDSTPAIKYNLDDHLGSSNVMVDEYGTLVNFEEYYPFGETSFGSYAKKRYRFCGKERDEESGLYYYGARYYSPWICRFVSVDPLAQKYTFYTPYQYAGNKPIISVDIDGLEGSNDTGQQVNNPSDTTGTGNTSPSDSTTTATPTDTVTVRNPTDSSATGADTTQTPKPHLAPKPKTQSAAPQAKVTGIKIDMSFDTGKGAGVNSTDYRQPNLSISNSLKTNTTAATNSSDIVSQKNMGLPQQSSSNQDQGISYNGDLVASTAEKYNLKFRYEYGSKGPATYDCSGFVTKVLKEIYPKLANQIGASSSQMVTFANNHGGIRKTNPQVGDLVFWGGHVEIISSVNGDSFTTFGASSNSKSGGITPSSKTFSGINDPKLKSYGNGNFKGFFTPKL